MSIPQKIQDAILNEIAEGKKLQEKNAELTALSAQQKQIIADLTSLLEAGTTEIGTLQAKVSELEELAGSVDAITAAIAEINPTPVSDAVVEEVTENPDIETPDVVETAPPVAPEVVQEPEVVQSALEALEDA